MYRKHPVHVALMSLPQGFNVEAFSGGSFEGQGDTRRLQVDEKEYNAVIVGPFGEDGKTRLQPTDKGRLMFVVVWQLDDEEQRQRLGLEKMPTKSQNVFLDLTPNGNLDMGAFKNAELNKLREAFSMNQPGVQWKFADFIGKVAVVKIENRTNKEDASNPYQNVTAVRPV